MAHLALNSSYTVKEQNEMLHIAANSIRFGLDKHRENSIDPTQFPDSLRHNRATFVTLKKTDHLRGCIGSLIAYRPLVEDISSNAYSAAFRDPRFDPLTSSELNTLHIHISVLSPPEKIFFDSEQNLLEQIQVGVDGIILSDQGHRATFLPSVWESLPDKSVFLSELKRKAGLSSNHWSDTVQVERYATFSFGEDVQNLLNT